MNKSRKNQNRSKRNGQRKLQLRLYRGIDPTYGKTVERIVKYRDTIQINSGASNFLMTADGNPYINVFYRLSQSNDFTSVSDSYFLARALEFEVKVVRVANDTQLGSMNISTPELYVAWNPCVLGYSNNSVAINNELALRVPPLSLEQHKKTYPIRPLQVAITDTNIFVYNPAIPTLVTEFQRLPGCLTMATFNTNNSSATVKIFQIELTARVHFYVPF